MKGPTNPFSPTFGISPPVLAGRGHVLHRVRSALEGGVGHPGRASLYVGARGTGKTVLLNETEDIARELGWVSVAETASPGLVERLVAHRLPTAARLVVGSERPPTRLTSIRAFGFGASWETMHTEQQAADLRTMLSALAEELESRGGGLLLTLDELQGGVREELVELATTVQHLFRERRAVAIVAAGLPAVVEDVLLDDPILTFFRRADRHDLGPVKVFEAADALRDTATLAGRSFSGQGLIAAAEATAGYPYMIQLVGFHAWELAGAAEHINAETVAEAVPIAQQRLGALVLEPALADLSVNDRRFLLAMAVDDGPSRIADLAERLDTSANQAGQYRLRLLRHQLIAAPSRGLVDMTLPYLRAYLRDRGALGETL